MNILYLSNHLNTGGITSYLLTLAAGMSKKGHSVYLASSGGSWFSRFTAEGIDFVPIPMNTKKMVSPKILASFLKLSKIVEKSKIQLVHSHSRTTQVLGYWLARNLKIKHILTCHGFFKRRLSRKLFPCWPDAIIAISEQVKEHLVNDLKADVRKIFVVPNGIDVEKFRVPALPAGRQNPKSKMELKKQLGLKEGPIIGIVARLSDVKGHLYLIRALPFVLEQIPEVQLLIVGDGKMKKELVRAVENLKVEQNVIFVPSVPDTREVFSLIDMFVMPSLKEGLGLALMEAMASGLAVIGSDVGGIRSLIQEGVNGLLVKPADVTGLSQAILRLLKDPRESKALGEAGRLFMENNFSQDKMVVQTQGVYEKCLNAY
ncbi:MAG: hypothetical protein AMJ95_05040 [Omnitrophica WOR_2 bacterium SM23_72]|nr:MAG: hypothetical protein AMJ95_05040 [Omnitrophica WOR_2 bacterium SM23_72]